MIFLKVDPKIIDSLNEKSPVNKIGVIKIDEHTVVGKYLLTDEKSYGHAFEYLNACEEIELELIKTITLPK